jgi:UDP-N-acetyl-2-amino-2-deoxyglucuronate dehydrogenase
MIRVGITGLGKVAHLHAQSLCNLQNADFRAVRSRSIDQAINFAAEYGVSAYDDIRKMVVAEKLDLVIVCTPHPNHRLAVDEALQSGAHVLVEKPLAANLADCDAMINTATACGRKLGVVSQRRFYAPVQRLKSAIDAGKIGKPALATVQMLGWRDQQYYQSDPWRGSWKEEGGGVLVNQAPHQLDILLWLMGEVDELFGVWSNLNHGYIEVEDTALAIVRFKNGGLGNIVVSNAQKPGIYGKIHVHGSNGASVGVQTEGGAMFVAGMSEIAEPPVNDLWSVSGEEPLLDEWNSSDTAFFNSINATVYYIERQLEDFLYAINNDTEPLVTGAEGRRTVELFTAIYRSHRDNRPIKFPLRHETDRDDFDGRKAT